MDDEPIWQFAQAHLDGRITDEEFAELQQLLETDSSARLAYAELARLDAELRESGAETDGVVGEFEIRATNIIGSRWSRSTGTIGIAAALFLVLIPAWMLLQRDRKTIGDTANAEEIRSIAVISAEADAVWDDAGKGFARGTALEPGILSLVSGLAQIDFFSGASITLSGPSTIDLKNSKLAILQIGRVRADVPPAARGFEIQTAGVRVEDLGTSFGISAGVDDVADIVVFDGEVRAIDRSGDAVSLFTGDVAHLASGKVLNAASEDSGIFPDIGAVIEQAGGLNTSRYASWKAAAIERRKDTRLVAYYDFEDLTDASRRLSNRALSGAGSELDGGIVGARVTRGRWSEKPALDFRGEGDRVRFQIPGEFDSLTLYAWVRIDALDRHLNSLFLTDYYDAGEIHWQLSGTGSLRFATSPNGVVDDLQAQNCRFFSLPFWDASKSGQWFLLATTVDRRKKTPVAHYVNGKKISTIAENNRSMELPKMRIGSADLGNWTEPISLMNGIRSLNGGIDEFAIYSVALTAEEILEIYEQGKP